MGHGKGSQEEENPFLVKKAKMPADSAGIFLNLDSGFFTSLDS